MDFYYKEDWGEGTGVEINGIFKLKAASNEGGAYWQGTGHVTKVYLLNDVKTTEVFDQPDIRIAIYFDSPPS